METGLSLYPNFLVFFLVLGILWIVWRWARNKELRLPPGPVGLPIVGYWPFLGKNVAHLQLYNMKKKYGPLVSMYWGRQLVVVLLDFPTLKEGFGKESFLGRPKVSPFKLVNDGVSFNDSSGHMWKSNRRLTMQILRDLGYGKSIMHDHVQKEVSELLSNLQKTEGQVVETRLPLTSSVSNNITALIFGRRLDYSDPLRKFLDNVVLHIMKFFKQTSVHAYFPWLLKILVFFGLFKYDKAHNTLKRFYAFLDKEIAEHRRTRMEGHNRDYIDGYLQELDDRKNLWQDCFTVRHLKGNIRTLFGAGSEATRTSLEWCLMTAAAFPDYQTKVQSEIDQMIGRDRRPTLDDIPRTPLTQAAIFEVLRWRGLVPLGLVRMVTEDEKLLGYDIPKGTLAFGHIWGVHHDSELWEDPFSYKPERFISEDGNVVKPEYFIPFSYGRRSCPGESMANLELYLYFASILQTFRVQPPEGKNNLLKQELSVTLQLLDTRLCFIDRSKVKEKQCKS